MGDRAALVLYLFFQSAMLRSFSVYFFAQRRILAAARVISAIVALVATVFSSTLSAQAPGGLWEIEYDPQKGRVYLNFHHYEDGRRRGGMTGFTILPSQITGLTQSQLVSGEGPVTFQFMRDAGTFNFEGRIYRGRGNGRFTFAPNPRFIEELARRWYGRPTAEQQFQLGLNDMSYALLDELRNQGYNRPSIEDLVTLGHHGVQFDYVRGLGSLGYRVGSTDRLQELRDHGVTPGFITGLASAGYAKLSVERLLEFRDHGVTPEFISGIERAGYAKLSAYDLLQSRDPRVTPAYIAALAKAGYRHLSTEELLKARDHGVTPDLADGFRRLGYSGLSLRQLIKLRDHGVTVAFAERVRDREGSVPVEGLIQRRDQGYRY
jgi:hypothetical protein